MSEMKFYLDIDKSGSNWRYILRLRPYSEKAVGYWIAEFNPYACGQRPGLMEKIVATLNDKMEVEG